MDFEEYKISIKNIELDNYATLLNMGRKWKKISAGNERHIKIGIIGSTSIQLVASVCRALLTRCDLYADIYEGEYDGIWMDALDENSRLYGFEPEYLVILPDYHDILEAVPLVLASMQETEKAVGDVVGNYKKIYDAVHKKLSGCQILMANFVTPYYDPMGNLSSNYIFSQKMFFRQVNIALIENRPPFVTILDVEGLAEYIGKKDWFDESAYFLNKLGFALQYIGYYCDLISRQIEAFVGKIRKCLILDLDNTLWGGIVGDDGYEGIILNPNDSEGEAYQTFQKYVLALKNRGVVLTVCSKNDEVNAREVFEKNPNMILKMEDISLFVANWDDKATNIARIADELNIGMDSMVFFDDSPAERQLIQEYAPEVRVIDVPDDPALYIRALDQSHVFDWIQLTKEDISRGQSYNDNQARNNLMASCVDYNDYLEKLQMQMKCRQLADVDLPRFVQLTNKSNQFNLRTNRYSEAEVLQMMTAPSYVLLAISLKDRFSNYGIIACVVLRFDRKTCFIENWVMSCRVLKRNVEHYTAAKIVDTARQRGCNRIEGEYIPSKKNGMVSDFYTRIGFQDAGESKDGIKRYARSI